MKIKEINTAIPTLTIEERNTLLGFGRMIAEFCEKRSSCCNCPFYSTCRSFDNWDDMTDFMTFFKEQVVCPIDVDSER